MKLWLKSALLAGALLAFGSVRLPFESGLCRDLRAGGLIPPRLQIATRDHIDQTSSAVALGGLRTLVATFLNLRAMTAFTDRRWDRVEEIYNTIVDLAPRSRYYWESGSWHLAYNAASYYMHESELPPLRRRELWRSYIVKGRAFLERGIRNNPDDWSLYASLGFMLSDPNKFPAFHDSDISFAAAAEAWRKASDSGKAPDYTRRFQCYSLARVAGKQAEALALARKLYAEGPKNRTPTQVRLLFVLEAHENPSMDVARRAIELFGSPQKAYSELTSHWQHTRERFPVDGVSAALESLEKSLAIPQSQSILNQALPPPQTPDDWFRK